MYSARMVTFCPSSWIRMAVERPTTPVTQISTPLPIADLEPTSSNNYNVAHGRLWGNNVGMGEEQTILPRSGNLYKTANRMWSDVDDRLAKATEIGWSRDLKNRRFWHYKELIFWLCHSNSGAYMQSFHTWLEWVRVGCYHGGATWLHRPKVMSHNESRGLATGERNSVNDSEQLMAG